MTTRGQIQTLSPAVEYGELIFHPSFRSEILGNERPVVVYLPPGYEAESERRYPVLYMQDGQNLFDGSTSFIPGNYWHLKETADTLIREGSIEPLIIVGVYNAGERRIAEYTPTVDPNFKVGGAADLYGRMLVEELMPFIDANYPTKTGRGNTGVGGSSLGGLVSLYLGLTRADAFGHVVAMSPSIWWNDCYLLRRLDELTPAGLRPKVWLDAGTREGANTVCHAEALRDALVERGFAADAEVKFMRAEGARHCEQDWAHRVHHALRFAYAAREDERREGESAVTSPRPFALAATPHTLAGAQQAAL
jgi:predicted alpha/beta superfamily hydrolase